MKENMKTKIIWGVYWGGDIYLLYALFCFDASHTAI